MMLLLSAGSIRENFFSWVLGILVLTGEARAESHDNSSVKFSEQIAPILSTKCLACHNLEKSKGGYRVGTFAEIFKPGTSKEPPIVPGEPDRSALFKRLTHSDEDERMPQKDDPLPADQVQLFRSWIAQGAKLDKGEPAALIASLLPRKDHPSPPETYNQFPPILAVASRTESSEFAVGGYHEILLCDSVGNRLKRIGNVPERVHGLAWLKNGLIVVAGGSPGRNGEAAVYNSATGELVASLVQSPDELLALAVSPDESIVAVGGADNTIHVFGSDNWQRRFSIQQHADWVMDLEFSADGKKLASASRDRTTRVYDATKGELETTYVNHTAPVFTVAFLDGNKVASAGRDRKIHLWKVEDGKKEGEISGFETDILSIIHAQGQIFALTGGTIRQCKISDRSLGKNFESPGGPLYALTHTSESRFLAGGSVGRIFLWDGAEGKLQTTFRPLPGLK